MYAKVARDKTQWNVNKHGVQIREKKVGGTVARVSSSFKTFIEWTQDAALLYLIQKRKVRSLLELQLICPVVTRITRMGQNNAVCYLTYLQSSVLFVDETQMKMKIPLNLE